MRLIRTKGLIIHPSSGVTGARILLGKGLSCSPTPCATASTRGEPQRSDQGADGITRPTLLPGSRCPLQEGKLPQGPHSDAPAARLWGRHHHRITQNHRMVGVGRDLCGSSSPTLLPKKGHLQQAAQDLVQAGLEYLQRRRLHNLPGQPVPGLRHPQREEVLPVLPHVQTELPLLQFVPIAPCPVTGHH